MRQPTVTHSEGSRVKLLLSTSESILQIGQNLGLDHSERTPQVLAVLNAVTNPVKPKSSEWFNTL